MKTYGKMGTGVLALALLSLPGVARSQEHQAQADLPGPIDSLQDLQDTGRMLFMMADVNHDGQISQKEATDSANRLVGGYFFQADADGNGTVTKEEARAVREAYLGQNPWARYLVESVRAQAKKKQESNQSSPLQGLAMLLDANNDKQIQATELRQLVQTTTQSYFAAADTNRDGQMSPSEVNASVAGGARAIMQAAFQAADDDNNNSLSRDEFDKAIVEPANVVFQILDLNHDGQISQDEAQRIGRVIVSQARMLQMPEPANSPTNLIRSGRLPREAAPVPTFGNPNNPGQGQPQGGTQPARPVPPQ